MCFRHHFRDLFPLMGRLYLALVCVCLVEAQHYHYSKGWHAGKRSPHSRSAKLPHLLDRSGKMEESLRDFTEYDMPGALKRSKELGPVVVRDFKDYNLAGRLDGSENLPDTQRKFNQYIYPTLLRRSEEIHDFRINLNEYNLDGELEGGNVPAKIDISEYTLIPAVLKGSQNIPNRLNEYKLLPRLLKTSEHMPNVQTEGLAKYTITGAEKRLQRERDSQRQSAEYDMPEEVTNSVNMPGFVSDLNPDGQASANMLGSRLGPSKGWFDPLDPDMETILNEQDKGKESKPDICGFRQDIEELVIHMLKAELQIVHECQAAQSDTKEKLLSLTGPTRLAKNIKSVIWEWLQNNQGMDT